MFFFFLNCELLHAKLNSHFKASSYKKMKKKKKFNLYKKDI